MDRNNEVRIPVSCVLLSDKLINANRWVSVSIGKKRRLLGEGDFE